MSRSHQAYEGIRQRIVDWQFPPGEPLVESDLSELLGVSRTPVRDALQQLSREHLVRLIPGRGAFVAEITPSDITEIYQMRSVLEAGAARLACHSPRRENVGAFVPQFDSIRDELSLSRVEDYYKLLAQFDQEIAEAADNVRLQSALRNIWSQSARLRKLASTHERRLRETVDEHIEIALAIADGRADDADAAVRDHLARSLDDKVSSLTRSFSNSGRESRIVQMTQAAKDDEDGDPT